MEFLRTPDLSAAWSVTPQTTNADRNGSTGTPGAPVLAPNGSLLDRNSIKSSFQTLFTPTVPATPFFGKQGAPSGLTPFINGVVTPNFVTPGIGMMPMTAALKGDLAVPQPTSSPNMLLSSPYLQAAAKEAVRREFMNMPTYIAGQATMAHTSGEQTVPAGAQPMQSPAQQQPVYAKDGGLVAANSSSPVSTRRKPASAQPATSPDSEARVPEARPSELAADGSGESASDSAAANPTSPGNQRVPQPSPTPAGSAAPPAGAPAQMRGGQPPFAPGQQQPFYQMHPSQGMYLMPQNGAMMMHPPASNPIYIHPGNGMMMFAPPGAQQHQLMPHPGMMMHPVHSGAMAPGRSRAPMKPETSAERKERIEREKQELIREFKKKTREAALVRFRQKRRERRFGKLIRYDCRKKLADARPRVKGRFVRIKADCNTEDTEDSAQVVPSME